MARKTLLLGMLLTLLLGFAATQALAQSDERGSIRGAVYRDMNGDGLCVNTGLAGETAVPNVNIEFVSSDEATIVTLYTGSDGTYGLVAAGQSVWRVTAKPDTGWFVTSENPKYVPVLPNAGLIQTDVNFCISQGTNAVIILPESGAAASSLSPIVPLLALLGMGFVGAGLFAEWRRRLS